MINHFVELHNIDFLAVTIIHIKPKARNKSLDWNIYLKYLKIKIQL